MDATNPIDPTTPAQLLSTRLKSQYAPAFLTLTSIIQGVAFTTLVSRVESTSANFTLADWLTSIATFVGFVVIWHEYLMQTLAYVWIPTLLDSIVPFAFLAAELFMAHFAYGNTRAWLLASACTFGVGLLVWATNFTQVRIPSSENSALLAVVHPYLRPRLTLNISLFLLFLAAWAGYDLFHLQQISVVVALASLIIITLFLVGSRPFWNAVLAYARGETPPANTPQTQRAH